MQLHLAAGIAKEFKNGLRDIRARFVGADRDAGFTVGGDVPRGFTGMLDIGISSQVSDMVSVQLDYSFEFSENFISHALGANVRVSF